MIQGSLRLTLRTTSEIQGFISACSQLTADVLCNFDINMELILKQFIRIECGFYVRLYEYVCCSCLAFI